VPQSLFPKKEKSNMPLASVKIPRVSVALVWIGLVGLGFLGCQTLGSGRGTKSASLSSSLFAVLSYAHDEIGVPLSAEAARIEVQVILSGSIGKFIDLRNSAFDRDLLNQVEKVVTTNTGRALLVTIWQNGTSTSLAYLPMADVSGFEDASGVFLSSAPKATAGCGLRAFGMKGSKPWCGVCAVGFCCGACRCQDCGGDLTSALGGLDLPSEVLELINDERPLDSFPLDTNLGAYNAGSD
jgi:hypothetical protein